ncbi:MAG TPA: right-handed parallel beta-helix repeat-containing protein, partial [Polyangia bacterium]|nr:right-handed parallel beta-helix repeat-containing protein [Polyangia bacterium]
SAAGNDSNDGRSPATAWKTLTKANGVTYQPGNSLCLKAGGSWTGQLQPKGSGTSAAPIVIDQYGSGAKPILAAGTTDANTVYLLNQQYWEINDLEVTNKKASVGDYRGISVNGQNGGTLNHIYIRNCFVHDVTGEVDWIGGSTSDNAPGVTFQARWDASKHTGGIVFDVQAGTGTAVKTKFNDVLIEDNTVQDCSFGGIIFKQLDGTVHWGTRSSATSSTWTPHTNVVVRGNYISQLNASLGCDAIYLTDVQTGLIEQNVSNGAGTSAIELYYTDSVTVQHNETFGTKVKAGGADSNGMDTDNSTTKTIIQYNYFHDNGDGILICQLSFGDSVIRYNIIQNNSRYQIYLHSDPSASSAVYNNTVYNNKTNSGVAYGYGTSVNAKYDLENNIFYAASGNGVLTTGGGIVYQNNLYFGSAIQVPAGDTHPLTADPKLVSPGTGTSGSAAGPALGSLGGYKLQTGSPAINAGVSIANNGGVDFWGDTLYSGAADVGAYETP